MKDYIRITIFTLMIAAIIVFSLDLYDVKASIQHVTLLNKPQNTDDPNTIQELEAEAEVDRKQQEAQALAQKEEAERLAKEETRKLEEAKLKKAEEEAKLKKAEEEKKKKEAERIAKEEAERKAQEEKEKKQEQEVAESKPKPQEKPIVTPNNISINGLSAKYLNLGETPLSTVQSYLNAGNVTATITQFSPNDSQTTYFAGHNPGVFTFMANNMQLGSVVTVTDSQGNSYNYKAIDYAYTNTDGTPVLSSIGISAQTLYNSGSGSESICIQYCINGTMIVWYCIPV